MAGVKGGGRSDDAAGIVRRRGGTLSVVAVWALAALGAAAGCGRINYQAADAGEVRGGSGGSAGRDVGSASLDDGGTTCSAGAPFDLPELLVVEDLEPDLYGPRLAADGLTLYLSQTRGMPFKDEDIYTATRPSLDVARFGAATRSDKLSSTAFDGSAFPSEDQLEIYFSSARLGGAGNRDLWMARRPQANAAFGNPTVVPMVNSTGNDQNPSLTDDGLLLFFASDRDGDEDIYVSFRANRGAMFSRPIKMPGLSRPGKDTAPFISGDGQRIYFTSDRAGGRGGLDIWTATRGNRLATSFDEPTVVPGVNSSGHDEDPSLSRDGRELLFSSNRGGAFELYRAVRCP